MTSVREYQTEALLYILSDSVVNASMIKVDVPVKTERSRLISTELYGIFSESHNNTMQLQNSLFRTSS